MYRISLLILLPLSCLAQVETQKDSIGEITMYASEDYFSSSALLILYFLPKGIDAYWHYDANSKLYCVDTSFIDSLGTKYNSVIVGMMKKKTVSYFCKKEGSYIDDTDAG